MIGCKMSWLLLVFIFGSVAFTVPSMSQTLKKKLDPTQLSCGQKALVDDQTCRAGEVLEITGSCLHVVPTDATRSKGTQYNCMKRK
jgi:hypothetical protein